MKKIIIACLLLATFKTLAFENPYNRYQAEDDEQYNGFSINSRGVGSSIYNNGNGNTFQANSNGSTSQTWRTPNGGTFTVNSDGSTSSTYGTH